MPLPFFASPLRPFSPLPSPAHHPADADRAAAAATPRGRGIRVTDAAAGGPPAAAPNAPSRSLRRVCARAAAGPGSIRAAARATLSCTLQSAPARSSTCRERPLVSAHGPPAPPAGHVDTRPGCPRRSHMPRAARISAARIIWFRQAAEAAASHCNRPHVATQPAPARLWYPSRPQTAPRR